MTILEIACSLNRIIVIAIKDKSMENLTLKELFPSLTREQRSDLGYALRDHGVVRIGEHVDEDGFKVRKYKAQDHPFIVKFAIKFIRENGNT